MNLKSLNHRASELNDTPKQGENLLIYAEETQPQVVVSEVIPKGQDDANSPQSA